MTELQVQSLWRELTNSSASRGGNKMYWIEHILWKLLTVARNSIHWTPQGKNKEMGRGQRRPKTHRGDNYKQMNYIGKKKRKLKKLGRLEMRWLWGYAPLGGQKAAIPPWIYGASAIIWDRLAVGDVVISCQSPLFPKKFPSIHYSVDQPRSLNKITT